MSKAELSLRAVALADVPVLRAIRTDVETQALLLAHPEARRDGDDTQDWLDRRLRDPRGAFLAIDRAGTCIGFVQLTGRHDIDRHGAFGIALTPEARGSGAGEIAMHELIAWAAANGLRKLVCEVRSDNAPALRLYERLGFRNVGLLHAHYHDGTRFWDVMMLELMLNRPAVS